MRLALRVTLPAVLSLVACGPQQRVSQCSPSATSGDKPPVLVVFAGESTDVEMVLPPAVFCQDGNPIASAVGTEVLNASNDSLPHTHTAPTSSDTRGYTAMVTFTPSAPGVYYLSARFEPSLGIARRQVQVVANRTTEPVAVRVRSPGTCDDIVGLEPFALCRRGFELSVLNDAGAAFTQSNVLGLVAAEHTAWWWTSTTVTRAVVVNGTLSRASAPAVVGTGGTSVSSNLLARANGDLLEVRFDEDAGLSVSTRSMPGPMNLTSPVASACREGATYGFGSAMQLCAVTDSTADASVRCVDSAGLNPAASEANVMWLRGAETGIVGLARVAQPPLRDPEVLFLDAQAEAMIDTKQSTPAFNWNGKFLSVRRQDLTLEAWSLPSAVVKRAVTAEHVVFQTRDEVLLYRR